MLLAGEDENADVELSQPQATLGTLTCGLTIGLVVQSLIAPDSLPTSEQITEALNLVRAIGLISGQTGCGLS